MRTLNNQNPEDDELMMDFDPLDKNLDYCSGHGDDEEISLCSENDKQSLRKTLEAS